MLRQNRKIVCAQNSGAIAENATQQHNSTSTACNFNNSSTVPENFPSLITVSPPRAWASRRKERPIRRIG